MVIRVAGDSKNGGVIRFVSHLAHLRPRRSASVSERDGRTESRIQEPEPRFFLARGAWMEKRRNSGRVTIYDVAERARVSLATVSRVMNGSAPVSDGIRERVREAADVLGFQPSLVASSLSRRETKTLGLIVPNIANPFFAEIARAAERTAATEGYAVFVCNTDEHPSLEASYIEALSRRQVDGLLLCTGSRATLELATQSGIPVVLLARDVPTAEGHPAESVVLDDRLGGRLAAEYLYGLGHRHLAYVGETQSVVSSEDRRRGFWEAIREAGGEPRPDFTLHAGPLSERRLQAALAGLLAAGVTALVVANDATAVRVVLALKRQAVQIPQEVSIVSFDDTALARLMEPALTSVRQPTSRMGRLAVSRLLDRASRTDPDPDSGPAAAGGSGPARATHVVRPRLIARGSTAAPRTWPGHGQVGRKPGSPDGNPATPEQE